MNASFDGSIKYRNTNSEELLSVEIVSIVISDY